MRLENVLENYGLSKKESNVYLSLLQLGSSSAQKIAQKSALARSTVYEVLDSLATKGLVSRFQKKKIKYFSPEEPDRLFVLAQNKVEAIHQSLPELRAIYCQSSCRPTVRFYQGKEQMKIVLDELLSEARELICFAVAEDLLNIMGEYHEQFLKKRIKSKIPLRLILRDSPTARLRQRDAVKHLRRVKIVSNQYEFHGLTYVWKNKIAMFSFAGDLVAVIIESKELANMQRAQFNYLWDKID